MAVDSLVSTAWLAERLNRSDVKVLDATWILPGALPGTAPDLAEGFIPGAQFFDIDSVAAPSSTLSHMLPTPAQFSSEMSRMGIRDTDHVVCYDRHGVFSSCRLWWTFQMFGHAAVSVLDGGLPAWIGAGHAVKNAPARPPASPAIAEAYTPQSPLSTVVSADAVDAAIGTVQIIDARPSGLGAKSVSVYDGSWADWGRDLGAQSRPIIAPAQPALNQPALKEA